MTIEKNVRSFSGFKKWIKDINPTHGEMLYRGMSSTKYDLSSSIARRIEKMTKKKPDVLDIWKVAFAVINDAKKKNYAHNFIGRGEISITDFELLALLQHHKAATPLIDFSRSPYVALWFACQDNSGIDAKIIAIDPKNFEKIPNEINIKTDSITRKGIKRTDENNQNNFHFLSIQDSLLKFYPPVIDPRIPAQNSAFILGKKELEICDILSICTMSSKAKGDIMQELVPNGISKEWLFPDLSGFSSLNSQDSPIKNLDQILRDDEESTEQQENKNIFYYSINPPVPFADDLD